MEIRKYLHRLEARDVVVIGAHLDKDGYKKISLGLSEKGKKIVMSDEKARDLWVKKDYKKFYEYVKKNNLW